MARSDEFRDFAAARYSSLVRTAFLLTGDRGQAEDLVQSTLLKTYLAWGRLRAPESAEAYARRTLVRLSTRSWRRKWRGEVPAGSFRDESRRWPMDSTLGAGTGMSVDSAIDIRRALIALPVGQRQVLVLRFLEDRSEAETARLLGISPGTVKSRTSRGLASLRQAGLLASEGERQ